MSSADQVAQRASASQLSAPPVGDCARL